MLSVKNRLYWKAGEKRIPLTGAFEISPLCNFRCKMCYVRKSPEECQKMGGIKPYKWWLDILKQAKDCGLLYPLFTGGEPFIYPEFKELYLETAKLGMQISVNTNASQITEKVVAWLKNEPPIRLNVTLYGASNETYEKLCGEKDAFDKVQRAIDLLYDNGIRFKFNASITELNQHELKEIIDFGKKYDKKVDIANYMFPPIRRIENSFGKNERVSAERCGYNQVLTDWYQLSERDFRKKSHIYQSFVPVDENEMVTDVKCIDGNEMKCRAGRCSFWVDWQGRLSMCGMIDRPAFDLFDKNFATCWDKVVNYVNEVRYSPVCQKCPNERLCHTCISMAYNESGSISGIPKYMCRSVKSTSYFFEKFEELLNQKKVKFGDEKIEEFW